MNVLSMDGWMDGMEEVGRTGGWMNGWVDGVDGWMGKREGDWVDGRMGGWMDS